MRLRVRCLPTLYLAVLASAVFCTSLPLEASSPDWIWAKTIRLTEADGIDSEYPEIAAHPDSGKLHVVWRDERYRADHTPCMYYKSGINRGLEWGEDVRISSQLTRNISFAIDYSGNLHVMWDLVTNVNQLYIWYSKSEDGGISWSGDAKSLDGKAPHLATDADGVHLLYQSGNYGAQIRSSYDHGHSWTAYHNVCSADWTRGWYAIASKLISDSHGLHALYYWDHSSYGRNLTYRGSSDGGVTWGGEIVVRHKDTGEEIDFGCDMCSDGQDILHVVWAEKDDDGKWTIRYTRSMDVGQNWLAPQALDNGSADSKSPRIASYGNSIYVVWSDSRDGNWEIHYKASPDNGANWSEDTRLTNAPGVSEYPSMAVDEEGAYIVWHDNRGGSSEIYYKHLGSNLIPIVQIQAPVGGETWTKTQEIRWYAEEPNEGQTIRSLRIQYSADGITWTDILFDGVNDGSLMWDTRAIPDNSYMIRITADDGIGQGLDSSELITIDNTPPTKVSGLVSIDHTVMQWSANGQVAVRWAAATDTSTGVDGYSTVWDEVPDTTPDMEKDIEELPTGASSPDLASGDKHYFHIRAVDNIGNWGESEHLGPFYIDKTAPGEAIDLLSSTHIPGVFFRDNIVGITWKRADDWGSGLYGYSIIWDTDPNTLPDETKYIEETVTELSSNQLSEGANHYFHIRSVDKVGNWGYEAAHIGPFCIDVTPPNTEIFLSGDRGWNEWYTSDVKVTLSAADNASGVKRTEYRINNGAWQIYSVPFAITGSTVSYRSEDNAGNMETEGLQEIKIDHTPPTPPHVIDDGDHTASIDQLRASWTSDDPESGIEEYWYAIGTEPGRNNVMDWTLGGHTGVTAAGLTLVEDQVYYFRVKAKNYAGLFSDIGISDGITIVAEPVTIHVATTGDGSASDGSAGNPYRTIQEGIDAASDGDTVLVADGVYAGDGNVNLDFKGKAITVRSENGAANCVIDCENVDNTRGFYFHSGESTNSRVDGFTIRNGNANEPIEFLGGGILCANGSSPTIENNIITKNSAGAEGGGIFCREDSNAVVISNTITDNSAGFGGGICCYDASPTITGNTISGNLANQGGGLSCHSQSSPMIVGNYITENSASTGGGIECTDSSDPTIAGNTIADNESSGFGGGIQCSDSSPNITRNTIVGNSASSGGGIHSDSGSVPMIAGNLITGNSVIYVGGGIRCYSSSPNIVNNTITGNSASSGGGIECTDSSSPTITNTILWNNSPQEISFYSTLAPSAVTVSYSDIQGGQAAIVTSNNGTVSWLEGNIYTDPLFLDAANGDYHLSDSSPCIGAGIMVQDMLDMDIEGNPRPNPSGSIPDIGAYESKLDEPRYFALDVSIKASVEAEDSVYLYAIEVENVGSVKCNRFSISYSNGEPINCSKHKQWKCESQPGGILWREVFESGGNPALGPGEKLRFCFTISQFLDGVSWIAENDDTGNSDIGSVDIDLVETCYDSVSQLCVNVKASRKEVEGAHLYTIRVENVGGVSCRRFSVKYNGSEPTYCSKHGQWDYETQVGEILWWEAFESGGDPALGPHESLSFDFAIPQLLLEVSWTAESDTTGDFDIGLSNIALDAEPAPGIIHIPRDYPTIQAGMDAASDGDTVLVADGLYAGTGNVSLDFKDKAITVKSESGAANCIIDCNDMDDTRAFYFHSGEGPDSVVDGFTIRNGNCTSDTPDSFGGGILCVLNSSPTIRNNIIVENRAGSGGGIACESSSPIIVNNVIIGNQAVVGGAIDCNDSSATITNNTIVGNSASSFGGGLNCFHLSDLTISNTIFWGNSPQGIYFHGVSPSTTTISYSAIEGGLSGITSNDNAVVNWLDGNTDSDPLFVDIANEDYHLSDDSPCIGAGIMKTNVPDTDIEGNPRPYPPGSSPDIGAYEAGKDTDLPSPPVISSETHDEDACSDSNNPSFAWTESVDTSGISGYSYILDHSPDTIPDTASEGTDGSVDYKNVDDGVWYFHVRAVDGAGNWGETGHYGPIVLPKQSILHLKGEPTYIELGEIVSLSGQLDAPDLADLKGQKIHFQTVPPGEESWEHLMLFDTDLGSQNDLDNGIIPEDLHQEFTDNGTALSPSADVSVEENGSKWTIADTDNKATYFVENDGDRLCIYLGGLTDSSGSFETNLSPDRIGIWRFRAMWDGLQDVNDCYLYASAVSEDAEVVVKPPLGKAVIVVGGDPNDDTWQRFLKLGKRAYDVFSKCGLSEDNIRFLCPDPTLSPSKHEELSISKQVLEESILNWGTAGLSPNQILHIYLVSDNIKEHGFILWRKGSETERLYKNEVHQWLEQLTRERVNVVFIMDSCYSGEYIQETEEHLNPPLRVVITSTDAENVAVVTPHESFSKIFFDRLENGDDLKSAYLDATQSMAKAGYRNRPQIDINGDAVYWSGAESELDPLEGLCLGMCSYATAGDEPDIVSWTKQQTLPSGVDETTIEASIKGGGVEAYAVIFSPGQLDVDTVESWESFEGHSIPLIGNENAGYSGSYDGFTDPGTYTIRIYAENIDGVAVPATTTVTVPVPGDLNSDGVIDVLDIVIVASRIGTNDPAGDINNDGKVDMDDLKLVLQSYEENEE